MASSRVVAKTMRFRRAIDMVDYPLRREIVATAWQDQAAHHTLIHSKECSAHAPSTVASRDLAMP